MIRSAGSVGLENSGAHTRRDADGMAHVFVAEAEKHRSGSCRCECSDDRRRMEAVLEEDRVLDLGVIGRHPQPHCDLIADRYRGK